MTIATAAASMIKSMLNSIFFLRDQFFMRSVKGGLVSIAAADAPLSAGLPALTFCPRFLRDAVGRGAF